MVFEAVRMNSWRQSKKSSGVFEEGSRNLFSKQTVLHVTLQDLDTVQLCNFGLFWDSTERFFEAPTLDQAPVNFFLISNSVNIVNVGYFHIKYST